MSVLHALDDLQHLLRYCSAAPECRVELVQFRACREMLHEHEVHHFLEARVLGQVVDLVAPVDEASHVADDQAGLSGLEVDVPEPALKLDLLLGHAPYLRCSGHKARQPGCAVFQPAARTASPDLRHKSAPSPSRDAEAGLHWCGSPSHRMPGSLREPGSHRTLAPVGEHTAGLSVVSTRMTQPCIILPGRRDSTTPRGIEESAAFYRSEWLNHAKYGLAWAGTPVPHGSVHRIASIDTPPYAP